MKIFTLLLLFFIPIYSSSAQTFMGKQQGRLKSYDCTIRINKDSTVNFIYQKDKGRVYGDYKGIVKKLNDTLYHISSRMSIGQFCMKSFDNDTIYIQLDPNIARRLDKIEVEYANGKDRELLQGYDKLGKPIKLLKIPVNKKLFNAKAGTDFIKITINRKNFLSDNFLSFIVPFGWAASFTSGREAEFDVVIKGNQLWTVGKALLQTDHFKLKMKGS